MRRVLLVTVQEVAELCRVSEMTVYRWIRRDHLPAIRFPGRVIRIRESDLIEFLEECEIR